MTSSRDQARTRRERTGSVGASTAPTDPVKQPRVVLRLPMSAQMRIARARAGAHAGGSPRSHLLLQNRCLRAERRSSMVIGGGVLVLIVIIIILVLIFR